MTTRLTILLGTLLLGANAAAAKPALCETSEEGRYPCDFRLTDDNGSFRITARGKPTYTILIDEPGRAMAFVDLGTGRDIALPDPYRLVPGDPGCWVGEETGNRICAE